jgi:acyl carrier protein
MTIETIKSKTRDFLSKSFSSNDIRDDEDIFALGFVNSLFAMQLVMFVENEFGMTIEDQDLDLDNFRSVDAIAGFVARKSA